MKKANVIMACVAAGSLTACLASDPNTYTATPEQMADAMIGKSSTFMMGKNKNVMRVTGGSAKGVTVALKTNKGGERTCRIRFEAVDDSTTRIVPDCGKARSSMDAGNKGVDRVTALEQAKEILTGEKVDVGFIQTAMIAQTAKNLPKMQGEALAMDKQMREMQGEYQASKKEAARAAGGWGSE